MHIFRSVRKTADQAKSLIENKVKDAEYNLKALVQLDQRPDLFFWEDDDEVSQHVDFVLLASYTGS